MASDQRTAARIQVIEDMLLDNTDCYWFEEGDNQFSMTVLQGFTNDARNFLMKMDKLLKDMVDFAVLYMDCVQLLGATAWCLLALNDVKSEYAALKPILDKFIQLEHAIMPYENTLAAEDQ